MDTRRGLASQVAAAAGFATTLAKINAISEQATGANAAARCEKRSFDAPDGCVTTGESVCRQPNYIARTTTAWDTKVLSEWQDDLQSRMHTLPWILQMITGHEFQ
jgi:hypothetical protein